MTTNPIYRLRLLHFVRKGIVVVAVLASANAAANAQSLTWDPSATPATGSQANGTWSATGTGASDWSNGTTDQTWLDGDTAVFGPAGAAGSATVSIAAPVNPSEISFTGTGYTLTGANTISFSGTGYAIDLATSGLNEEIDSTLGTNTTAPQDLRVDVVTGSTLTLTGGVNNTLSTTGKAFSVGGGGTLVLTSAPSVTTPYSTIYNLGAIFSGSGTIVQEGNTEVLNGAGNNGAVDLRGGQGDGVATGTGVYTLNGAGAEFNTFHMDIGQGNNYTVNVQQGTMEVGNDFFIASSNDTTRTTAINDSLVVSGTGQVVASNAINIVGDVGTAQNATLEIDGGITVAQGGIAVGGTNSDATSTATFNLTGGKVFIGSAGITTGGAAAKSINFSGGTVGATADWSTTAKINLTNKVTFQTSDVGATVNPQGAQNITTYTESDSAHAITLNGVLSGTGGLEVTGPGTLTLAASNTYVGNTEVASGAELILSLNTSLALGSTLTLDDSELSFLELNFTGTDTISGLTIDGVVYGPGTYGAGQVGFDDFDGTGTITVIGAVPEPRTWVMLIGGLVLLVAGNRRLRSLQS